MQVWVGMRLFFVVLLFRYHYPSYFYALNSARISLSSIPSPVCFWCPDGSAYREDLVNATDAQVVSAS